MYRQNLTKFHWYIQGLRDLLSLINSYHQISAKKQNLGINISINLYTKQH